MVFKKARPIWLCNLRSVVNLQAGFRCDFDVREEGIYKLRITGASLMRAYLNGRFIYYGPARAAHGYAKVDELDLMVKKGKNKLAVDVAGYNCGCFEVVNQKSFLCAEIMRDDEVIAYTGHDFFGVRLDDLRSRYEMRYSFQRTFTEYWKLDNACSKTLWRLSDDVAKYETCICEQEEDFILRTTLLPEFNVVRDKTVFETGTFESRPNSDNCYDDVRTTFTGSDFCGYPVRQLKHMPVRDFDVIFHKGSNKDKQNILNEYDYIIYKMPYDNTGFLKADFTAHQDSLVYVFFSETLCDGKVFVDQKDNGQNIVAYELKKSDKPYETESFECYTCMYIGVACVKGSISVDSVGIREYCYPKSDNTEFHAGDERLNIIFEAARQTFRQNTVDIFMDCPGRERGGWLCDSYFTAIAERLFTGENKVETTFLNNFCAAKEFPALPPGVIPMCYPADFPDGQHIPQYNFWFIIELAQHIKHNNDINAEEFRKIVLRCLDYFKEYENEYGLLENLPGWNFIEWSKADDYKDGIHYPTNMLYSFSCRLAGGMYGISELLNKADKIRETIIERAFDGITFVDNEIRIKGKAVKTSNRSEICQYLAFFCGIADRKDKRFSESYKLVLDELGPKGKKTEHNNAIAPAAEFVGNYIRIQLLLRWGKGRKFLEEFTDQHYNMAKSTGTLWEHSSSYASVNHGFASCAADAVLKAVTGILEYNFKTKKIKKGVSGYDGKYKITIHTGEGDIVFENGKTILPEGWSEGKYDITDNDYKF